MPSASAFLGLPISGYEASNSSSGLLERLYRVFRIELGEQGVVVPTHGDTLGMFLAKWPALNRRSCEAIYGWDTPQCQPPQNVAMSLCSKAAPARSGAGLDNKS